MKGRIRTMKKEIFTIDNVKEDLKKVVSDRSFHRADSRVAWILLSLALAAVFIFFLKKLMWLCIPCFLLCLYHIIFVIKEAIEDNAARKEIDAAIEMADFSVSISKFSHVVYENKSRSRSRSAIRRTQLPEMYFCFAGGRRWRVPEVMKHYAWSPFHSSNTKLLVDTSIAGDEFYFITLKSDPDIGYIYKTRHFQFLEYNSFADDQK